MTRRVPVLPTIVVLAAVATMIALGFWQLGRMRWKEDLLARYAQAQMMSADVEMPGDSGAVQSVLFRHAHMICFSPSQDMPTAGHNSDGETGWSHVFSCYLDPGPFNENRKVNVSMGWSVDPDPRMFRGGRIRGIVASNGRLVVDPDLVLPGLQPNAVPDPRAIPNNHLSYALQWFFFAATALTIYLLALRKRWRGPLAGKASAD